MFYSWDQGFRDRYTIVRTLMDCRTPRPLGTAGLPAWTSVLHVETGGSAAELWDSIVSLDPDAADRALVRVLAEHSLARALEEVFVPLLQRIGDRWEDGSLSVAHEHFASQLLRRRLSALTAIENVSADIGRSRPVALLACPAGERHDLMLLCFALLLGEAGWRTQFLGGNTPVPILSGAARASDVDVVVLAATRSTALTAHSTSIRQLAARHPVFIAGRGADEEVAHLLGARLLPADPVAALAHLCVGAGEPGRQAPGQR